MRHRLLVLLLGPLIASAGCGMSHWGDDRYGVVIDGQTVGPILSCNPGCASVGTTTVRLALADLAPRIKGRAVAAVELRGPRELDDDGHVLNYGVSNTFVVVTVQGGERLVWDVVCPGECDVQQQTPNTVPSALPSSG